MVYGSVFAFLLGWNIKQLQVSKQSFLSFPIARNTHALHENKGGNMMEKDGKFNLTATDFSAIELLDSNYINNKGAKAYSGSDYATAVEYYRLAAAMGNVHSVSNLGYCYLYGRDVEANLSLAIAYLKIAARREDVDAAYKLGDIYGSEKWGVQDKELSVYYYRMAVSCVLDEEWENSRVISWSDELKKYPSLCYAMGRELSEGGSMTTDLDSAYQFLKKAEEGYEAELMNGNTMYAKAYSGVEELLMNSQFDRIRDKYDEDGDIDDDGEYDD